MYALYTFLRTQIRIYAVPLVVSFFCLLLKLNADMGSATQLKWILAPLSVFVSMACGLHFHFNEALGYVDASGTIVLGTTCAGINFMIIALLVSSFTFLPTLSFRKQCLYTPVFVLASWGLSLFVNTSRIAISLKLLKFSDRIHALGTDKAHEALGVLYYLFFLLVYFFLVRKILSKIPKPI